jgi:hypothetical protein
VCIVARDRAIVGQEGDNRSRGCYHRKRQVAVTANFTPDFTSPFTTTSRRPLLGQRLKPRPPFLHPHSATSFATATQTTTATARQTTATQRNHDHGKR